MGTQLIAVERLNTEREHLKRGVFAQNTVVSYGSDWKLFHAWCRDVGREALPATPETVALYLAYEIEVRKRKVKTAERRTSAIGHYHRQGGYPCPLTEEVRLILKGARRIRREKPRRMRPLTVEQLRQVTADLSGEGTAVAARDRAILVVGFASALRRSSLIALRTEDLEFCPEGAVLSIWGEKQDQEGKGRQIGLPHGRHAETCPVRALRDWLALRPGGTGPGPLFTRLDSRFAGGRMDKDAIGKLVKRAVQRIGLDPALYCSHSLRASLVTAAIAAGASEIVVAAQTGHRCLQNLRVYYRKTDLWTANAASMIDL